MLSGLNEKIQNKRIIIGIVGQGYVGFPLAMAFAASVKVVGFDVNERTISMLKAGKSHIIDIKDNQLQQHLNKTYFPSMSVSDLAECDVIIICVPTPLKGDKIPDLSYIISAAKEIASILHKDQYVVLESTTYPGTTNEVLIPILEEGSGLVAGKDFGVAFSPERIDPGNKQFTIDMVPKVVGGMNLAITEVICSVYNIAIPQIVPVSSTQVAESVKMVENIFRHVNIALANELALIFEKMDVNTWEVMDAAATKPYGFMPFYPGPGIGGHCIPLDPYYLSYKAKKYGVIPRFIETAGEINTYMEIHVINLASDGLKRVGKEVRGSKIAVLGLAYKKDIDDVRESPSLAIIEELVNMGADVRVYDPFVKEVMTGAGKFISSASVDDVLSGADCAIFLLDHTLFKLLKLKELVSKMRCPVVIDAKNLFMGESGVVYLGIGKTHELK